MKTSDHLCVLSDSFNTDHSVECAVYSVCATRNLETCRFRLWALQLGDYDEACMYLHHAGRIHLYLSVYEAEKVEERARVIFNAAAAALNYAMPTEGGSSGILQTARITMPPSPL